MKRFGVMLDMSRNAVMKVEEVKKMANILHSALQQYEHNITLDDTYDIFDSWLNVGHSTTDFIPVILEIYKASGIIKDKKGNKDKNENKDEKN